MLSTFYTTNSFFSIIFNRYYKLTIVLFFSVVSFFIYGHYVFQGTFTQSGDFGPAVSYALNFKEAIHNGQWIPRWIIIAREVTLGAGAVDGTAITPDAPAFQYYAFLQSALAYPLIWMGISGITALQIVVIVSFALSGCILYKASRLLDASRIVSLLSGYGYLLSPWLISNFYGRGGISEAISQSILPLLLLAYAYAIKQKYKQAMLSIALGTFMLALSHNVFLLYGMIMCSLLIGAHIFIFCLSWFKQKSSIKLMLAHIKISITLVIGIILGLAASSWQWLPILMTLHEVSFSYIGNFKDGLAPLCDFSGIWGLPKQFIESWSGVKREFFFTIGWWTLPAILGLVFSKAKNYSIARIIFFCFIVFFIFTYWPNSLILHLPFLSIAQFTFRFLAFLSVLGSFALCIAFPTMPRYLVFGVFLLITMSQLHVIFFKMSVQKFPDEQYLRGYEYNAFYANSIYEKYLRAWYNGWLQYDNRLNLKEFNDHTIYLKITGKTKDNEKIKVFIAKANNRQKPLTEIKSLQGSFETIFKLDHPEDGLRFFITGIQDTPTNYIRADAPISMRAEKVVLLEDPISSYIPATEVNKIFSYGYKRIFEIIKSKQFLHQPREGLYTIELPIIYNRLVIPRQNGKVLLHQVDFNHRLQIKTNDLNTPITVVYSLPNTIWALSIVGILSMLILMYKQRRVRVYTHCTPKCDF